MAVVEICHLYISPGHNFFGHHGREPADYPAIEVPMIECVAGQGIRGDRFFGKLPSSAESNKGGPNAGAALGVG